MNTIRVAPAFLIGAWAGVVIVVTILGITLARWVVDRMDD